MKLLLRVGDVCFKCCQSEYMVLTISSPDLLVEQNVQLESNRTTKLVSNLSPPKKSPDIDISEKQMYRSIQHLSSKNFYYSRKKTTTKKTQQLTNSPI